MRREVESEGVIYLREYIRVWTRFTGQIPGRRSVGLIRGYGGALVLTNRRVLATVSTVPRRAGRAVDQPWASAQDGAVTGTLSQSGLVVHVGDLSRIDPRFSGTLSLAFKTRLGADAMWRLPTRSIAFDVPPKFVYGLLGVPRG